VLHEGRTLLIEKHCRPVGEAIADCAEVERRWGAIALLPDLLLEPRPVGVLAAPLALNYRHTLTPMMSKWWSKVHAGASSQSLISAITTSTGLCPRSAGSSGRGNILRASSNQYLTDSCSTGARSVPT
jgi:hypothetical protein